MTDNHYNRTALPEVAVINVGEPVDAVFSYDKWRIRVYSNDPNPPRFHIIRQGWNASFAIQTGELLECKGDSHPSVLDYMCRSVKVWLDSQSYPLPAITNRENAQSVWEQIH